MNGGGRTQDDLGGLGGGRSQGAGTEARRKEIDRADTEKLESHSISSFQKEKMFDANEATRHNPL